MRYSVALLSILVLAACVSREPEPLAGLERLGYVQPRVTRQGHWGQRRHPQRPGQDHGLRPGTPDKRDQDHQDRRQLVPLC